MAAAAAALRSGAGVEAQRFDARFLQGPGRARDDFVVHRAAELRMRMQDQRDTLGLRVDGAIQRFQLAVRRGDQQVAFGIGVSGHSEVESRK